MTSSVRYPALMRSGPAGDGRRAAHPDPLAVMRCLTKRDRMILSVLGEHQVLTTQQICDLAFPSLDLAQRRLLRLTQLSVVDRFRWRLPAGSEPWHYTLGMVGAALVAAERATEPPRPAELRKRSLRLATSPRLGHLLGINGFFCALASEARGDPGAALSEWWSERRCSELYGELVRPDGYGAWTEGGPSVEFFLELDTGTEPLGQVAAKLAGYADLALAGGPGHRVLIWLPSAAREAHLHAHLAKQPPPRPVATATAELAAARGCSPAGALWLAPGSRERRRLIGLTPDVP